MTKIYMRNIKGGSSVVMLVLLGLCVLAQAQDQKITFSAAGDGPYGANEIPIFQQQIADHNRYSPSAFFVHVGDIFNESTPCDNSQYAFIANMLRGLAVPAYIIPGDNETIDCGSPGQALNLWKQNFINFEHNFCGATFTEHHSIRPENWAFLKNGVLFIGINMVGGSSPYEYDANWVSQQLQAKGSQVRAAVVFSHVRPDHSTLFSIPFRQAAAAFGKPILFLHGHGHSWSKDNPFPEPNILRVQLNDIDGEDPVEVTVTLDTSSPETAFTFERNPWSSRTIVNLPPCINAGIDQTISFPQSTTLNASASDDGDPNPPGTVTVTWSKVSGPGTVTFGNSHALATTAQFSSVGAYILRLTANDGKLQSDDEVKITTSDGRPIIDSFTPAGGAIGTEVTITGSNFTGVNGVAFNGKTATSFIVDNITQIRAKVPADVSTGKISITNSKGTGLSSTDFTVQYSLTVNTQGSGSVALNPAGGTYNESTLVTLTPQSGAGFTFSGWSGDLSGSLNPATITMNANKTVTATFTPISPIVHEETITGGASNSKTVKTSASLTGTKGHLYLAAISTRPNVSVLSVSGLGLSWTLVKSKCAGRNTTAIEVWKAQGAPSGNGAVTATLSSAAFAATIAVSRYSGVATNPIGNVLAGNPNGMNETAACSGGVDNSSYSFNVKTTVAGAVIYGAVAIKGRTHVPGPGYIERAEMKQTNSTNISGVAVEDRSFAAAGTVTINGSLSDVSDWAVVALEIKPPSLIKHEETQTGGSSNSTVVKTSTKLIGMSDHLYLAAISSRSRVKVSTVSGLGLSWTLVKAQCSGRNGTGIEVWMAQGEPSSDDTVRATFTSAPLNAAIAVSRYSGADGVNPLGSPISGNTNGVNGICSGGVETNSYSFNLTTTLNGSVVYAAAAMRGWTHTPGAGYTERAEILFGNPGVTTSVAVEDKSIVSASTILANGFFSGMADWAAITLEIKPQGAKPVQHTLTVNTVGSGSVMRNPPGETYNAGTVVTLTATPASGFQFSFWSGALSGSSNPAKITMNGNKTVTATFTPLPPQFTLTVNKVGSGSVALNPPGGNYNSGTVVTLTPQSGAGFTFSGWSGDLSGSLNPAMITMNANKTVTATFTPNSPIVHEETITGGASNSKTVKTSASLTGTKGHLYLAAISTRPNVSVLSVSGLGLSWTLVKSKCAGRNTTAIEVWKAQGAPSGNGAVTATLSSAAFAATIAVSRYSGVATNPIGNVLAGSPNGMNETAACSGGVDNSSYSFNVTTTVAGAVIYGAIAIKGRTHVPGPGYIERAEMKQTNDTNISGVAVEDRSFAAAGTVTINGSLSDVSDWAVVALEIKPPSLIKHEETQTGGSSNSTVVKTSTKLIGMSGHLYLAAISTRSRVTVSSVSGLGLSWTLVKAQCSGQNSTGIEVWMAQGAPSSADTVKATFISAPVHAAIAVSRYSGVDGVNPLGNLISGNTNGVNGLCSGGVETNSYSFNLNTSINGLVVYAAATMRGFTHTPGAGYTERAEIIFGSPGVTTSVAVEDKRIVSASTVVVDGSFSGMADWAAVTLEIQPQGGVPPQFNLTVNAIGSGNVTLSPSGGTYEANTVVTLTAQSGAGFQFSGWSGDLSGSTNPATITMTGNKNVTATFTPSGAVHQETQTGQSSNSNAVTTSAPLTGANGHLYLAAIAKRWNVPVLSVSGLGLNWTLVQTQCTGQNTTGIEVWKAQGTPSGNGAVTAILANAPSNAVIAVSRYSGVASINPVGNLVFGNTNGTNGSCAGGVNTNAYTFNLATSVNGVMVYAATTMRGATHTPGAGYTERAEILHGSFGATASVAVEDKKFASASTIQVNGAFSGSVDWAVVALEIKPEAAMSKHSLFSENAPQSGALPTAFALEQNYPNPFSQIPRFGGNPSTTISFSLPAASYVTLKIFNLAGEEVATLVSQEMPANVHQVKWNASGMANGVYIYQLRAGDFVASRKLLLIK